MKKFFALLLSACLFISCGINDFSKKSSITFTIPTEALVKLQSQAREALGVEDYNPDTQNPVVEKVITGDSGTLGNESPQNMKFLVYAQLKGSKKGYYKSVFKEVTVSSSDYESMFSRSIIYDNKEIQADNAEISFSDLPVNQTYDIYVDIFSFENKENQNNVIRSFLSSGSKTDVSLNAGDNNVAIIMNDDKNEEYYKLLLEPNCSIISNDKAYSAIGKYEADSDCKYYLLDYGTDGSLAYWEEINQDCNYKFDYDTIDRFPEIKLYPKEYDLENEECIEIQFKLGDYYLCSSRINIINLEANPEGNTEVDVLPIYQYFEIMEDNGKFIFSRGDLFNQTSVTYLIDDTNKLTIDDVKKSLNFKYLTQDGVEIPDANFFTLWLFVQSGIEGTYYFNLTFEKENGEWIYYTNEEKEYLPISTYFDLIINKDDEGNYYPTVELKQNSGLSPNSIDCYDIFISGKNTQVDTDTLSTSKDSSYTKSNFGYFNVVDDANQTFTVSFAAKINGTMEYFSSQIIRDIDDDSWYTDPKDDKDLCVKTASSTSDSKVNIGKKSFTGLKFENPDFTNEGGGEDPTSYVTTILLNTDNLKEESLNIGELNEGTTLLFRLIVSEGELSYNSNSYIFYCLCDSIKNDTCYNNCINIPANTKELTIDLPIECTKDNINSKYLLINFQNVTFTNSGQLSAEISYKKFKSNEKLFTLTLDQNKQRYELRIPLEETTFEGLNQDGTYKVSFKGKLKQTDLTENGETYFSVIQGAQLHLDICQAVNGYITLCGGEEYGKFLDASIDDEGDIEVNTELKLGDLDSQNKEFPYYLQILFPYDSEKDSGKILYFEDFQLSPNGITD